MLNKAFKFFSSRSVFNTKKISTSASNTAYMIGGTGNQVIGDPEILWENICFIDDEKIIWTHGQFYASTAELTNLINNKADKSELNSYVSKAELSAQSYLTVYNESDPTVPSYVKGILESDINNWNSKQGEISDLETIRTSAFAGAAKISNIQGNWNTTNPADGSYIHNKPTIPDITGFATETYVNTKVAGIVNSAPETLDTLNELATALGNDPNFATTVSNQIGTKVSKTELSNQSYVTQTSLSSNSYVTQSALSTNSYVTQTSLSSNSYVTQSALSSNSYVTQTSLSSNSYVTQSALSTNSYVTQTSLSSNSYAGYAYVYAAYSYIINAIIDNEYVIATGFNLQNDRLTVLENAVNNLDNNLNSSGFITQIDLSSNSYAGYAYVYAAYSYIMNAIIDNEYVISGTFNDQNDRLTVLENAGYLTSFTETDPTVPSYVKSITQANINAWNSYTNVQVNWNETDNSSYAYILNKPDIPLDNVFIIPVIKNGTSYTTTVTKDEAREALFAGKLLFVLYNHIVMPLRHYDSDDYGDYYFYAISNSYIYTMNLVAGSGDGPLSCYYSETAIPTVPSYVKSITQANINAWNSYANVQADWNETNSSSAAYIQNKPIIPSIAGLATETYVNNKVASIVNSAPETLDTLNELATALGNDPNFATTVSNQIGTKVSKTELAGLGYVTQTTLSAQSYITSDELETILDDATYISSIPSNYITTSGATLLPHAQLIITDSGPDMFCTITDNFVQVNYADGGGASAITSAGVFVTNDGVYSEATNYTIYHDDSIVRTVGNSSTTINLPSASGTIALTSEIPSAVTESTVSGWGFTKNAAANDTTITITKGSYTGTFTTNASTTKTINIPNELPSYSSSDEGKILSVNSSGQLVWITPVSIYTGSGEPSNSIGNDGDIYIQS